MGRGGTILSTPPLGPHGGQAHAHILNRWIRYVEATGHELAVTLLVGGTTISGYLTPRLRHDEWVKEILLRAVHEGGRSSIPAVEMEPITPEMAERVREAWGEKRRSRKAKTSMTRFKASAPAACFGTPSAAARPRNTLAHLPLPSRPSLSVEAVFMAHTTGATLP